MSCGGAWLVSEPPGELVRTRATPPQVGHDRLRRLDNVRDAFDGTGRRGSVRPMLLIDDVATTGATLDACAARFAERRIWARNQGSQSRG